MDLQGKASVEDVYFDTRSSNNWQTERGEET